MEICGRSPATDQEAGLYEKNLSRPTVLLHLRCLEIHISGDSFPAFLKP